MIRRALVLGLVLATITTVSGETGSVMKIDHSFELIDYDPGIEGSTHHSASRWVLVIGAEGYAIAMDKESPSTIIPLAQSTTEDLLDSDYHPGGNTALAVGKNGTVLRYSNSDQSLEMAALEQSFGFDTLLSVSWNANGEWAYVGAEEGSLFRMRTTSDGGSEVLPIPGTGGSAINAIDCLPDPFVCVVVSQNQGIGVVDRDHRLSWIGGAGRTWSDVVCRPGGTPVCIGISMERYLAEVSFDGGIPSVDQKQITGTLGTPMSLGLTGLGEILVVSTPAEILEHKPHGGGTYTWLTREDINSQSFGIGGSTISSQWDGSGEDHWIVTRDGTVALLIPVQSSEAPGIARLVTLLALGTMGLMALGIWSTRSRGTS
mgnify:FL=1|jgi:hypothetical protein